MQKLRRCREDREDFTSKDGALWPMYITKGGPLFSFCPGKATWDIGLYKLYNILMISSETGCLYESGGLSEQPMWFVELLGWFLPRYNERKFYSRAKSILGDGDSKTKPLNNTPMRR